MNKFGIASRLVSDERAHVRLRVRTAEEWVKHLNKVAEDIRPAVASLVWWDFADVAPHRRHFTTVFEPWLDEAIEGDYPANRVKRALVKVGYAEPVAHMRSSEPSTRPPNYKRAYRSDYRRDGGSVHRKDRKESVSRRVA